MRDPGDSRYSCCVQHEHANKKRLRAVWETETVF